MEMKMFRLCNDNDLVSNPFHWLYIFLSIDTRTLLTISLQSGDLLFDVLLIDIKCQYYKPILFVVHI